MIHATVVIHATLVIHATAVIHATVVIHATAVIQATMINAKTAVIITTYLRLSRFSHSILFVHITDHKSWYLLNLHGFYWVSNVSMSYIIHHYCHSDIMYLCFISSYVLIKMVFSSEAKHILRHLHMFHPGS